MEVKCPCQKKEIDRSELVSRSPLDVLVEKFKDLPISSNELIDHIKQLACKVSEINDKQYCSDGNLSQYQNEFFVNDEIKGEIRKFVDDIYKRKSLKSDKKIRGFKSPRNACQDFYYTERWTWDSKGTFYGEQSDIQESYENRNRRSLYRPSSTILQHDKLEDRQWLIEKLGVPLKMALKEIVAKKPYDPVSYLGFWLLHHKKCEETARLHREMDEEIFKLRRVITQPTMERHPSEIEEIGEDQGEWNFRAYEKDSIQTFAE